MVLIREQAAKAIRHILEVVLRLQPDSPIHQALNKAAITTPADLVNFDKNEFEMLLYQETDGDLATIPRGHVNLLKEFKAFAHHTRETEGPIVDSTWLTLTADKFNEF